MSYLFAAFGFVFSLSLGTADAGSVTDTDDKLLTRVVNCETKAPYYKVCNSFELEDGANCTVITSDGDTIVTGPDC